MITVTRLIIRAKIEKALESRLSGPWRDLQLEFGILLEKLPTRSTTSMKLVDLADCFTSLKGKVEKTFEDAFDWPAKSDAESQETHEYEQNMNPRGITDEPHIQVTNQPNPVNSNIHENMETAKSREKLPPVEPEKSEEINLDIKWGNGGAQYTTQVELETLMSSCRHFAEMAHDLNGYVRDWNELHRAAANIRPIAGISEDAWNVAQQVLGPHVAAAAIALIFDKHSTGEVQSPGGYLRGIIEKARAGELHLDRSFYGRLNERVSA